MYVPISQHRQPIDRLSLPRSADDQSARGLGIRDLRTDNLSIDCRCRGWGMTNLRADWASRDLRTDNPSIDCRCRGWGMPNLRADWASPNIINNILNSEWTILGQLRSLSNRSGEKHRKESLLEVLVSSKTTRRQSWTLLGSPNQEGNTLVVIKLHLTP